MTYAQLTSMSTSERLSRFDLEIHKVGHQECLTVDRYIDMSARFVLKRYIFAFNWSNQSVSQLVSGRVHVWCGPPHHP
jgi:hypothetical protein